MAKTCTEMMRDFSKVTIDILETRSALGGNNRSFSYEKNTKTNQKEKEIDAVVEDCVDFALSAPEPDPSELTRYIWAED